MKLNIKITEML